MHPEKLTKPQLTQLYILMVCHYQWCATTNGVPCHMEAHMQLVLALFMPQLRHLFLSLPSVLPVAYVCWQYEITLKLSTAQEHR